MVMMHRSMGLVSFENLNYKQSYIITKFTFVNKNSQLYDLNESIH